MIVSWNVKGFNRVVKQKELKLFLRNNDVSIIALYEYRVKEEKSRNIMNKVMPGWKWCSNTNGQSRSKIWLALDPTKVRIQVTEKDIQYIHVKVQFQTCGKFELTSVYGLYSISDREPLWGNIQKVNNQITNPWLIMGDFSSVLNLEDRPVGS